MTKDSLLNQLTATALESVMMQKGYAFFKNGDYNLNIIGIRGDYGRKVTNKFDDFMVVLYNKNGELQKKVYSITTDPGKYYMQKPSNVKGTAILVPNQYRGCWQIGKHNGKYTALVQCKPVSVFRDANKDGYYAYKNVDTGLFGINIHRSNPYTSSSNIDNWSAGCQVFASVKEFNEFMGLCVEQRKRYGNSFTYTLIDEKDLG
jgi:hypothetical protein